MRKHSSNWKPAETDHQPVEIYYDDLPPGSLDNMFREVQFSIDAALLSPQTESSPVSLRHKEGKPPSRSFAPTSYNGR